MVKFKLVICVLLIIIIPKIYGQQCTICYEQNNETSISLSCTHMYHHSCIIGWIISLESNTLCPVCRELPTNFPLINGIVKFKERINELEWENGLLSAQNEQLEKELKIINESNNENN